MAESLNSFSSKSTLTVGGKAYTIHRLAAVEAVHPQAKKLPFSLKILLENLLRNENGLSVRKADIDALALWQPKAEPDTEIAFTPGAGTDAGLHRRALRRRPRRHARRHEGPGRRPGQDQPARAGANWSSTIRCRSTSSARRRAFADNAKLEYERNHERYRLPALGAERVPQLQGRAAGHGHLSTR